MEKSSITVDNSRAGEIIALALDVGTGILISGGEINRAENTIERMCKAMGAESTQVFAIPFIVSASVSFAGGVAVSQSRRVSDMSYNLKRVEQLNAVSRHLCDGRITFEQARRRTDEILSEKSPLNWKMLLGAALACGGFSVFFGGSVLDGIFAALIGILIIFLENHRPSFMNQALQTIFSSFVTGILAMTLSILRLPVSYDNIIIGVIMLIIPGLAVGNAIKELLLGNTISGSLRIIQSLLFTVLIALGFAASFLLLGGLIK